MNNQAHEPQPRPKFAQWLFERGLKPRDVHKPLGCSHEQVRLICLPYGDDGRRNPSQPLRQKIAVFTKGDVGVDDWGSARARPYRARAEGAAL